MVGRHDAALSPPEGREGRAARSVAVAAAAGEAAAWDGLVRRYSGVVHAVAVACGLDEPEAEAVADATWLGLVDGVEDVADDGIGVWVATRALVEAGRVRGGSRAVEADAGWGVVYWADGTGVPPAALARLDERSRLVVLLLSAEPPLRHRDVAEVLGTSVGGVRRIRRHALAQLRTLTVGGFPFEAAAG